MNPGCFEHKNTSSKAKAGRSTSMFSEVPEDDTDGPMKPGTYAYVLLSLLLRYPSTVFKIHSQEAMHESRGRSRKVNPTQKITTSTAHLIGCDREVTIYFTG